LDDLSRLLKAVGEGDSEAKNRLLALMYEELHSLAHARLSKSAGSRPLDTTELVHESYLRLLKASRIDINDRAHFFAYAAKVMRSIIVDFVRVRRAERWGGNAMMVTLDTSVEDRNRASEEEIIRVSEALEELAQSEPRLVQVVEMRYFGGFTEEEVAAVLGVTERTVRRDWRRARLLLSAALE
jgi:RNA polymerase sigma factor (TIGR02999 family)